MDKELCKEYLQAICDKRNQNQEEYLPLETYGLINDDEPIPYTAVDLAPLKLVLIQTVIEHGMAEPGMPEAMLLDLVGQIKDLEVGS